MTCDDAEDFGIKLSNPDAMTLRLTTYHSAKTFLSEVISPLDDVMLFKAEKSNSVFSFPFQNLTADQTQIFFCMCIDRLNMTECLA